MGSIENTFEPINPVKNRYAYDDQIIRPAYSENFKKFEIDSKNKDTIIPASFIDRDIGHSLNQNYAKATAQ